MSRFTAAVTISLVLACPAPCQHPINQQQADQLLAAAKARFAPDRRTVVFDVAATVEDGRLRLSGEVHDAELKRRLLEFLRSEAKCEVSDGLEALPEPELGERTFGIVCVSVANLRVKPGHAQELGTQALLGTPLRILKKQGAWLYVQTPNDYLCWTNDRIHLMSLSEHDAWQRREKVIVTSAFDLVRRSPETDAQPVGDVVAGCILTTTNTAQGHHAVRYADGRTGYLREDAAAPLGHWLHHAKDTPTSVVTTARRFLGVPYLWGGTSAKGMDCSGFTHTVYFLNGVLLPRDASQQVLVGEPVEIDTTMSHVKAGDLLFFGSRATTTRRERVTHVGISLGGSRFIHSSTDVHENSFDAADPDYSASLKRRLLHVRRIIGSDGDRGVRRLVHSPFYRSHDH